MNKAIPSLSIACRRFGAVLFLFPCLAALAACTVSRSFSQGPEMAPAPLPTYRVGDTFQFDTGRTDSVEAVDPEGGEVTWRTGGRDVSRRLASFVVPRLEWRSETAGGRFVSEDASNGLWPLSRDSRQEFSGELLRDNGNAGPGHRERVSFDCWVGATRTVTVPAGTFDTFQVNCVRRSTGGVRRSRLYTWYYAPAVGHYVVRIIAGGFGDINQRTELVRWLRLAPPGKAETNP